MIAEIYPVQLAEFGLSIDQAFHLSTQINQLVAHLGAELAWNELVKNVFQRTDSFKLHLAIFTHLFPHWQDRPETAPAWIPDESHQAKTNLGKLIAELHLKTSKEFHRWSILHYEMFWTLMIKQLQIQFQEPPQKLVDLSAGIETPNWLVGAKININDSCFHTHAEKIAIIYQSEDTPTPETYTYAQLHQLSSRIASSLIQLGLCPGEAIAIYMPMTFQSIAIYLGIIKMGGVVVSIADSFAAEEIAIRLQISHAKAIFTQESMTRNKKIYPLYSKVIAANAPMVIVISDDTPSLRPQDLLWDTFLSTNELEISHACNPMDAINILFSSGTTGIPKAIPWNHTTPIKVASDAHLHLDIHPTDILAWPTSLGWMMGPWLIFASLINQATMAIYAGDPNHRGFGEFIANAKVTMLGVVPTLVAHWRKTNCMENLAWDNIKRFASTGESSHPEDMLYLMSLAHYKPIIEYCGGTEIGGAYITSTLLEKNYPSLFTTPAMGSDFVILDEKGQLSDQGEVGIIPPAIGLSTTLLNANHHTTYYEGMPSPVRRHGDELKRYENGLYSVLGRHDDTMNLAGIKISSIEIERAISGCAGIKETAAISRQNHLIIYAVALQPLDNLTTQQQFQDCINKRLNPLFKIHEVIFIDELPKTVSNKILRRKLRKQS